MKKILVLLFFCLSPFILTACFPDGEQNNNSSEEIKLDQKDKATPEFIEEKIEDNLVIKARVVGFDNTNLKRSSISLKEFDEDKVKDTFLVNNKIVETNEVQNAFFPEYIDKYYDLSDDSSLSIELGSVTYRTPFYMNREYDSVISDTTYFVRDDLENVFKATSLEHISKEDAINQVKQTAEKLGIKQLGNPQVIAFDLKTLEQEWEDYETKDGSHPRHWEKDDEAYAVIFPISYENINITNKGYFSLNSSSGIPVIGSRILGIVNKGGLIYMTANGIYDIGETVKEKIKPISIENALTKLKDKYENTLLTDLVTISKISLEYVPVIAENKGIEYELVPCWVFTANQEITVTDSKGTSQSSSEFSIIFNAETGEEILIGGEY
ncbi:hypothetical protein AB3U99_18710 [Niallia sp. JL1B1071]|uniref:DUF6034 family protein n=1 Tax=Niallia tiangongensis TaxID=3237105 RepID=UPI0037DC33F9